MVQERRLIKEISCESKRNELEIAYWKEIFLEKNPIPQPIVNHSNKVIAFASSFYTLQDLELEEIWCTIKNNNN